MVGQSSQGDSRSRTPSTDLDLYAFGLRKADRTGKAAPRGPRKVGDKQRLDSRGGLRTVNLSLGLEGWPKQQASAPSAGL